MAKNKSDLTRLSMNIPKNIDNKVKEYANSLGVNVTTAYIYLITQALEQKNAMTQMPMLFDLLNTLNNSQNLEEIKEKLGKLGAEK